jgi:hypothetical protein
MNAKLNTLGLGAVGLLAAGPFSSTSVARAEPSSEVRWRAEKASFSGTGCSDGDVLVTVNGNDVSFVLTKMGVWLEGYSPLEERRTCTLRMPGAVAPGHYITRVEQSVAFGLEKTRRASASVAVQGALLGFALTPRTFTWPDGQPFEGVVEQSRFDAVAIEDARWHDEACKARRAAASDTLQSVLSISARRAGRGDTISVASPLEANTDVRYDLKVIVSDC